MRYGIPWGKKNGNSVYYILRNKSLFVAPDPVTNRFLPSLLTKMFCQVAVPIDVTFENVAPESLDKNKYAYAEV